MSCYDTESSNKYLFTEMKNDVSTGDGRYKLVYAINGEIPGPNIVVFEDQVVSTLSNDLNGYDVLCILHTQKLFKNQRPYSDERVLRNIEL